LRVGIPFGSFGLPTCDGQFGRRCLPLNELLGGLDSLSTALIGHPVPDTAATSTTEQPQLPIVGHVPKQIQHRVQIGTL
jgi:hypothetical protein